MVSEKVREYVEKARNLGYSDGKIRASLRTKGWQDKDIDEVLDKVPPTPRNKTPPESNTILNKINQLALWSFILSIVLFFLPVVGLILGIVALVQIKKSGEKGKIWAIAGIIISMLILIALLLFSTLESIATPCSVNT